jgi:tetratricopeptide (TPR) repeat protein
MYCAQTVKRQLETKEYDVKDWSTNCINLAEYFIENNHYAQAEYILFAGISILPPPNQKDEDGEHRAMMQSQIGRYYLQRLKFGVDLHNKGVTIGKEGPLFDTIHKQFIDLPTLNLKWPSVTDVTDIEQAKFLFRLANTQFKKALEFLVIDGYVTDHSRLKKDIADLYKYLILMETNQARIYAMYERRRESLEPIVDVINPEAYEALWTELSIELVNILHEMFDLKYAELKHAKKMPKKGQFDLLNSYGNGVLKHGLAVAIKLETLKELGDRDTYIQAIINQRLAVGKIYSKLYDLDKKVIVGYYAKALENYKQLDRIIRDYSTRNDLTETLEDQFKLCKEMVDLLPLKIEKIAKS